MKFSFKMAALAALMSALAFGACRKDKNDDLIEGTGSITLEFHNKAGSEDLRFDKDYRTPHGDTIRFSLFNYFISNIELIDEKGEIYVVPKNESYFLCKHDVTDSRKITIPNVPAGNYKAVRFVIGVDSLMSAAPLEQRTGVLDPVTGAAGMYWAWNSGYIFVKMEGTSPQAPMNANLGFRAVRYHIGGFGGYSSPTINNIKTVTLEMHHGDVAKVRRDKKPDVHIEADVLEIFDSPTRINLAVNPSVVHFAPFSVTLANNYVDMFHIENVHNE